MFNRITNQLSQFPPKQLRIILLGLVTGDFTVDGVLRCQNNLKEIIKFASLAGDFQESVGNYLSNSPFFACSDPIVDEYKRLPLLDRAHRYDDFMRRGKSDAAKVREMEKIKMNDLSVLYAVTEWVNTLALKIYAVSDAPTEMQCVVMNQLRKDVLSPIDIKHDGLRAVVIQHQRLIAMLVNAEIAPDVEACIKTYSSRLLELEVSYRATVNKAVQMLFRMQARLEEQFPAGQGNFMNKTTFENAAAVCRLVSSIPKELDVKSEDADKFIPSVCRVFFSSLDIINSECSARMRSGATKNIWKDLEQEMATVLKFEGVTLNGSANKLGFK